MGKKNVKQKAVEFVPQSRAEADSAIASIGEQQRTREDIQTRMNCELAAVKARYEFESAPVTETISTLSRGVQVWAEANRIELTREGRVKTCKLGSGEIRWRTRPPSLVVRGADTVIDTLRKLDLGRFLRTKTEVDKEALLKEPDVASTIKGLSISQGEDFVIVPFATELEEVA